MPEGLRVTPEQLIALNDEIASLVRSGVPLELGLRELSGSVPSALGRVSSRLSERLQAGQPLGDSLAQTLPGLPRVYVAVVDAGLKSGNLPKALESMSRFVQQGLELRQRVEVAFIYPLTVFLLAYVLFLAFVVEAAPRWSAVWGEFVPHEALVVDVLMWLSRTSAYWIWIPPTIVFGLIGCWLLFARRSFLPDRPASVLLNLVPGLRSVVVFWHWSNFCELLATLLEHEVPLPVAINLAADATGNAEIHAQMTAVSADLKTGQSMADSVRSRGLIPRYLRWSLGAAQQPEAYQSALRHGAELYRSRATFRADMIKMWLPICLVIFLGGGAALIYALSLALPLQALYWQLSRDGMR